MDRNAEIERLYKSGLSLREVAGLVRVTHERVRQILNARSVEIRPRGATGPYKDTPNRLAARQRIKDATLKRNAPLDRKICAAYRKGQNLQKLAAKLGMTKNQIIGRAHRIGLVHKNFHSKGGADEVTNHSQPHSTQGEPHPRLPNHHMEV